MKMIQQLVEEMSRVGSAFDLAGTIMEQGLGGEEWKRVFEIQNPQPQDNNDNIKANKLESSGQASREPSQSHGEL